MGYKCLKYRLMRLGRFGIREMYYLAQIIMKKALLILSLSLFVIATQSCKKPPLPVVEEEPTNTGGDGSGGEEEEEKPSEYVGSWDYTKVDLTNGILEIMGNEIGTFEGSGSNLVGEVAITEKPNRYSTSLSFTANIQVFGQAQSLPVDKQTSSGTWTEANGEITLVDDSGQSIAILSSTSSKIVFTGKFTEEIAAPFGSIDATSDVVFTIEK